MRDPNYHHKFDPSHLKNFYHKVYLKLKKPEKAHDFVNLMYKTFDQIIDKFEDVKQPLRSVQPYGPLEWD